MVLLLFLSCFSSKPSYNTVPNKKRIPTTTHTIKMMWLVAHWNLVCCRVFVFENPKMGTAFRINGNKNIMCKNEIGKWNTQRAAVKTAFTKKLSSFITISWHWPNLK